MTNTLRILIYLTDGTYELHTVEPSADNVAYVPLPKSEIHHPIAVYRNHVPHLCNYQILDDRIRFVPYDKMCKFYTSLREVVPKNSGGW